ncbi:uncharacterized protein [Diabrotica undecimpunctata]|uniref:uncharacterized protein n=1 Tax=Diabrotica undecimpunctata TaxID=50387 RepID=UPI003B641439
MTSRGKFLVQMCLDEGEASTSHENNAELWSSKSTSQHIPILSAGTSTTEGSFNTTLMQGCSTTTSDNEKENTKHCEEHNSSIEVSNIPVSPTFEKIVVDSGSDFSTGSSDNYIPSDDDGLSNVESTDSDVPLSKQECRWRRANPSRWKRNIKKKNRMSSLPYKSKGTVIAAKKPKLINCNSCKFKCSLSFNDDFRNQLCSEFWRLDYNRQKDYILCCVASKEPTCRRVRSGTGALKTASRYYHFLNQGKKIRVCKNFFLRTLCISHGPVDKAFSGANDIGIFAANDKRGKKKPANKTKPDIIASIKAHVQSFPTMASHYCRSSTKREYLDSNLSIAKMYELYVEDCKKTGKEYASQITYRRIFGTNFNLSFFNPKKDQCLTCTNYLKTKAAKEKYQNHIKRRDEANLAKQSDKERAMTDNSFLSVTFDLQSVLQIPSSDVSPMYYSRKLCAYNLTIYEAASQKAHCYAWTEINGQRGSSEIGTCLLKFIKSLPQNIIEISLFSDTCSGQNRNQFIAALFLFIVQNSNLNIVQHNFLESGHSYMEVDSMHSAIENAKKNVPVYTMHDWLNIFRLARSKRGRNKRSDPYNVQELRYNDFLDIKTLAANTLKNRTIDENGNRVNWLKIKCMRYEADKPQYILFKYNYSDPEFLMFNVVGRTKRVINPIKEIQLLYSKEIPISKLKKQDLLKLCMTGTIPSEFHAWYQSIPSESGKKDVAPEPSVLSDSDLD